MITLFNEPSFWLSLLTLTTLEIILGIDNIIFLSLIVSKLPLSQQKKARRIGLFFAMITRLMLLASIMWVSKLSYVVFSFFDRPVSIRDIILFSGGYFLIWKGLKEIKHTQSEHNVTIRRPLSFMLAIIQIMLIDIVFSLDSVITAIGISEEITVIIIAIVIAVGVMMLIAEPIAKFISRYQRVKTLAMILIIFIGVTLIFESIGLRIPKEYIYFSIFFSISTEIIQIITKNR